MSASNWKVCPVCFRKEKERLRFEAEETERIAVAAYGTVPVEEYMAIAANAAAARAAVEVGPLLENGILTLREDYEIFSRDTTLHVSYWCLCEVCGFQFSFRREAVMLGAKEDVAR